MGARFPCSVDGMGRNQRKRSVERVARSASARRAELLGEVATRHVRCVGWANHLCRREKGRARMKTLRTFAALAVWLSLCVLFAVVALGFVGFFD